MTESWVTTTDNPYDPFTQWDEWYAYDRRHGYGTCEYVDRVAKTSDKYSDEVNDMIIEQAIDEIVQFNWLGIYKKVKPNGPVPLDA